MQTEMTGRLHPGALWEIALGLVGHTSHSNLKSASAAPTRRSHLFLDEPSSFTSRRQDLVFPLLYFTSDQTKNTLSFRFLFHCRNSM